VQGPLARAGRLDGRGSGGLQGDLQGKAPEKSAWTLAEEFVELYGGRFPKAVSVFEAVLGTPLPTLATREAPRQDMHNEDVGAVL
jgi:hypothetical protein